MDISPFFEIGSAIVVPEVLKYCRILDIFLCVRCGIDIQGMPNTKQIVRKLLMYYELSSLSQKKDILLRLPWLQEYIVKRSSDLCSIAVSSNSDTARPVLVSKFFRSLSQSDVWRTQSEFYSQAALSAWSIVPYEISSNAYVAKKYCDTVEKIMESVGAKSVCIVEIAAGHGILSYLMAKELQRVRYTPQLIFT